VLQNENGAGKVMSMGRTTPTKHTHKMKATKHLEKMKAETKQERELRFARIKAENRKAGRLPIAVRV